MDKKTILESVRKTGCVVTVEEHQAAGGMGFRGLRTSGAGMSGAN